MFIKYVSIDGADDAVDPKQMLALSERFKFIEWGILLSPKKEGVDRFPTLKWVRSLEGLNLNLCAHLCGKYVADIVKDEKSMRSCTILQEPYSLLFNRYQLNMTKKRLGKSLLDRDLFTRLAQFRNCLTPFIFAGDYVKLKYVLGWFHDFGCVFPLYDASGGHGVPTEWLPPFKGVLTGYAGGLRAENIVDYLDMMVDRLEMVKEDNDPPANIWIGSESGVRDEANKFSLERAEALLTRVDLWMAHKVRSYGEVVSK